jgi:hypothetical protein
LKAQLFGAEVLAGSWQPQRLDIGAAEVRAIAYGEARALIEQNEYLGTMPAVATHCFGIFFGGRLGGAVVYDSEYGENLGLWDFYGYTGKT